MCKLLLGLLGDEPHDLMYVVNWINMQLLPLRAQINLEKILESLYLEVFIRI